MICNTFFASVLIFWFGPRVLEWIKERYNKKIMGVVLSSPTPIPIHLWDITWSSPVNEPVTDEPIDFPSQDISRKISMIIHTKDMKTIQKYLNAVAQCNLIVDGIEGQETIACVEKFQKRCMQIQKSKNLGNLWPSTQKELAYHASYGNTIKNCFSPQSSPTHTVAVNHSSPRWSTSARAELQNTSPKNRISPETPIADIFGERLKLVTSEQSDHLILYTLSGYLEKLGCIVPELPNERLDTFWLPYQVALDALKKTANVNISTDQVYSYTFRIIERMVLNNQHFPWCQARINDAQRGYNTIAGK